MPHVERLHHRLIALIEVLRILVHGGIPPSYLSTPFIVAAAFSCLEL
jgi:hypothetical protein